VTQLAIARVLVVKGDLPSLEQALSLIKAILQKAESEGRTGVRIEALALQALSYERCADTANALTSLEYALRLAEPEGYLRIFVDLGLSMAHLLQKAQSRDVMPDYVKKLLSAYGEDLQRTAGTAKELTEPLTDREREILGYLAAGLTNQEIAEELVISSETVKKHASNIYGKLGVGSRTEAASKARELDLLE
jgi:LuxR family maltose regulon positive regulatory protein